MKIVLTELFASIQGEGIHAGEPSLFVRMPACNLKCPGFGLPRGEKTEVAPVPEEATELEDLQIPIYGCDSAPSWDSRYRTLWKTYEVEDLLEEMLKVGEHCRHIVFTGGEPLLPGSQKKIVRILTDDRIRKKFQCITFETNGTQSYLKSLEKVASLYSRVTFSVSPKLSISGEPFEKTCIPKALLSYSSAEVVLKFVVRDHECLVDIDAFLKEYDKAGAKYSYICLMPEGSTIGGLELTERQVADICMDRGYRYSPRLHVHLYGNTFGT